MSSAAPDQAADAARLSASVEPPPGAPPKLLALHRLLLSQAEAIALVGVSRAMWFRLRSAGRLPRPISVPGNSRPFWRRADLERWVANLKATAR
jgi:predicted DNA-binding transcriptional regulator AlpA